MTYIRSLFKMKNNNSEIFGIPLPVYQIQHPVEPVQLLQSIRFK